MNAPAMNTAEAIKIIEGATAHLQANRDVHLKIMEAIRVISAALVNDAVQGRIAPAKEIADVTA